MRIRFDLRYLLISAVLFSLPFCRAQTTVPGSVTFNFGGTNSPPLWDLSGTYSLNLTVNQKNGIQLPLTMSFNMVEDAAGNLHGVTNDYQALTIGNNTNTLFTVTYVIVGKVTGSGGNATARFTIDMVGKGTLAGENVNSFSAGLGVAAVPNPEDGQLEGEAAFIGKPKGFPSITGIIPNFSTALPSGANGTWTLTMQVNELETQAGTAVIITPSQTLGFTAMGPLKDDVFKIKLRGSADVPNITRPGTGSTATILADPMFDSIEVDGKFMGQKLDFAYPSD